MPFPNYLFCSFEAHRREGLEVDEKNKSAN